MCCTDLISTNISKSCDNVNDNCSQFEKVLSSEQITNFHIKATGNLISFQHLNIVIDSYVEWKT